MKERQVTPATVYAGVQRTGGQTGVVRPWGSGGGPGFRGQRQSLIHNWLARHRQQTGAGTVQAEQATEITRLKRLLAQREEEVAILKKAAAYFARESR